MRSLPMIFRLAEEMTRIPRVSPFHMPFFHEPMWTTSVVLPRKWQQIARWQENAGQQSPSIGKNGYQVSIDVSEFQPNELTVKTVDNHIIVEGKSEQEVDDQGGYSSRHFLRRFVLPKGYDADKTMSTLSSDGVLTVSVPMPPELEEAAKERVVPIQQTGPAVHNVKPNPPVEGEAVEAAAEKTK